MDDVNNETIGDYQRGIETMHRLWGEEMADRLRAVWKNASPDVERYITAFALGEVWSRPVLDLKTRSLICLAASVALERDDQVRLHTRGAIHSGATSAEVTEAIIQLMVYASFPAAWRAMVVASEVIAEHGNESSA
jgi:4-carboxymuconolactone decarboxylase